VPMQRVVIATVIAFAAGGCAGLAGARVFPVPLKPFFAAEERTVSGPMMSLTSPLLECAELPKNVSDASLQKMQEDVQELVNPGQKDGTITYSSIYFRDLNNGPWFGINESDSFFPASLLKLPLAMAIYDRSESDPTLLAHAIVYTPDAAITSQLQPYGLAGLTPGKTYSVQELVDIMLKDSSNEAAVALANFVGQPVIDSVYRDLGLPLPQSGQDYTITTHRYGSFFRILYNATYDDRVASEKILKTLTATEFPDGLVSGVPAGITVAHKFGTRAVDDKGTVQLHDCGIVYAPQKPYILCVMTQGHDFTKLAAFIKSVSASVYQNL